MTDRLNIAIVGAGIGGVVCGARAERAGHERHRFRSRRVPREAGAGLSIPPNAVLLLKRTALRDDIERITTRSPGLTLRSSRGEPISPGSPAVLSYQIHRVEFLEMLLGAVKGPVRFGHRCIAVDEAPTGARLRFANGAVCDADVVIGADGIHSIVQREIGLTARPTSEGIVAYRGLVRAEKLSWAGAPRLEHVDGGRP